VHGNRSFLILTLLLSVPVFLAFAYGICYLNSLLIGWRRLARRFASDGEPRGEARSAGGFPYTVYWRWWTAYSWIVCLSAGKDALYMSVKASFRPCHPPLRIPWDEIQLEWSRRFFQTFIELTLGRSERVPMRIRERMARELGILDRLPTREPISVEDLR
jgi:hypothetical protein